MRKVGKWWFKNYRKQVRAYVSESGLPDVRKMVNDYYRVLRKHGNDEKFDFNPIYEGKGHALLKELKDYLFYEGSYLKVKKGSTKMTNVLQLDIFGYWFASLDEVIQRDITELMSQITNGEDPEDAVSLFDFENQDKSKKDMRTIDTFITSFFRHLKNNDWE